MPEGAYRQIICQIVRLSYSRMPEFRLSTKPLVLLSFWQLVFVDEKRKKFIVCRSWNVLETELAKCYKSIGVIVFVLYMCCPRY